MDNRTIQEGYKYVQSLHATETQDILGSGIDNSGPLGSYADFTLLSLTTVRGHSLSF